MKLPVLVLLFPILIGCESLQLSDREIAWQTLHAADVLQTYHGPAKDPRYVEADPFTKKIIGTKPSGDRVILWGVGSSVAHYYVMKALDDSNLPKWTKNFVWGIDFSYKGYTIYNNHKIGIRLDGNNKPD